MSHRNDPLSGGGWARVLQRFTSRSVATCTPENPITPDEPSWSGETYGQQLERRLRVAFSQWLDECGLGAYGRSQPYDLQAMLDAFTAGYHLLRLDENPRDQAMTVACPTCQVGACERCVPHMGGLVHRERVLAWNRSKGKGLDQ